MLPKRGRLCGEFLWWIWRFTQANQTRDFAVSKTQLPDFVWLFLRVRERETERGYFLCLKLCCSISVIQGITEKQVGLPKYRGGWIQWLPSSMWGDFMERRPPHQGRTCLDLTQLHVFTEALLQFKEIKWLLFQRKSCLGWVRKGQIWKVSCHCLLVS